MPGMPSLNLLGHVNPHTFWGGLVWAVGLYALLAPPMLCAMSKSDNFKDKEN
jgi:hypothetical protein